MDPRESLNGHYVIFDLYPAYTAVTGFYKLNSVEGSHRIGVTFSP